MSQGHTGGRRAPARWTPAALRPQGHSHGVQLSLPLSKAHRPPRQVPAAPASSAPVQGPPRGGGRGAPAPHRAPHKGTPASVAAPLAAGAQCWFRGAPLAGGVWATRASLLGSPRQALPAGPREGPCCTLVLPVSSSGIFLGEQGGQDGASSGPMGLAQGSGGLWGHRAELGRGRACPAIAVVPVGTPLPSLFPSSTLL